jgi:hypothetical protein
MLLRRQRTPVPPEVVNLLVALAERNNAREGCSRPGNYTLAWDTGLGSKDTIRKWLSIARDLGAVTYRSGRGRGRATEVRFTSDVLQAPQLDYLSRLDGVRLTEAETKSRRPEMPSRRLWVTEPKGRDGDALFLRWKGRQQPEKRASDRTEKGETATPPTAVATAVEPLLRPAAASLLPADQRTTDYGNGALIETLGGEGLSSEDPLGAVVTVPSSGELLPRVEQFRRAMRGSGRYQPISEDEEVERRRVLAEQASALREDVAVRHVEARP